MKIYLIILAGLLIISALVSLVLGNWEVLIVVAMALASVVVGDLAWGWSSRYSEETEKYRERWLGKKTIKPTYYYDDGDEEGPDSDSKGRKNPR